MTAATFTLQVATSGSSAFAKASGTSDDLAGLTLSEASRRLRSKETTSTQLTQACLDRIKIYNPKINAFITVMQADAFAQAAQLDSEAKAGKFRSPLHGIPIALKDNIDTAGTRTTAASEVFDDRIPPADAEVTRRLKQAGAVIIGKTNLHEFAMGDTSATSYFGPVRNPWALDYISAGSSGGSAAAVISDSGVWRAGNGYGRLGAHACCVLQHCGTEADLWTGINPRNHSNALFARSLRSHGPDS